MQMASENADAIERYFDYFQTEYERILSVEVPLHRLILIVIFISALARGRYPSTEEREDKKRFVRVLEECSGWGDAKRVSISQLKYSLDHDKNTQAATGFKSHVDSSLSQTPPFSLPSVSEDPAYSALLSAGPNEAEKRLLDEAKHSSLLYYYRCRLVHEFRRPGYGMELSSDNTRPYYHSMSNEDDVTSWELVYPVEWLTALPNTILRNLKAYYLAKDRDPYAGYDFGSHWRERRA